MAREVWSPHAGAEIIEVKVKVGSAVKKMTNLWSLAMKMENPIVSRFLARRRT